MIRITTEGDGQRPKLIDNGGSTSRVGGMATPNTLARIEDPRAWHARGEVGIQQLNRKSQLATDAIALPMAPPLPEGRPIRARKVVLEEDEYVERLGDIIEGDYFPHNAKMYRALSSLAEGVHGGGGSNTPSGRDRAFVGTPSSVVSATPGASTPGRDASGLSGVGKEGSKRAMGTGGALTAFVARHTSEDNEAFAELQVTMRALLESTLSPNDCCVPLCACCKWSEAAHYYTNSNSITVVCEGAGRSNDFNQSV